MPISRLRSVALAAALALWAASAHAVPLTFTFSGTVSEVGPGVAGVPISLGDPVSGIYSYESTTTPTTGVGLDYGTGLLAFDFTAGGYTGTMGAPPYQVEISVFPGVHNYFFLSMDPPPDSGADFQSASLVAWDSPPIEGGFDDMSLPLEPLDPDNFDFIELWLSVDGETEVRAEITSVTAVPEPATFALMLAGLAAGGLAGAQRRR